MNGRPSLGVSLVRLLPRPSAEVRGRREMQPASDVLVARVCAVIDLLVASGLDEELAYEAMAQRLIGAEIPPPNRGPESCWANCLRELREILRNGRPTEEALNEYKNVIAALDATAPHERVQWALDNEVWDRRQNRSSVPRIAWVPPRIRKSLSGATQKLTRGSPVRVWSVIYPKHHHLRFTEAPPLRRLPPASFDKRMVFACSGHSWMLTNKDSGRVWLSLNSNPGVSNETHRSNCSGR